MKRELKIADTLSLPLDWITLSTVVYGARGSGKTTLGSVVAEEVYAQGQRFCAIDLKGDWWGLKSSADGNDRGIPIVIFGGDHQDLPLEPDAGVEIANLIAKLEQPAILDLEHLSKGKQLRFLAAFFERLYDANREPLLLLLDEAQRYAAQKPMSPDATVCLGAVEDLVKLGRKHGIGPMLFTQRGSGLNKEVSELCDMLVAFRTPGSLDQDRVKDWLGANAGKAQAAEIMEAISGLPTGTAVFASNHPALRIAPTIAAVRQRRTYDSSATPKVGQRRREPKVLAEPELVALREQMAEAIERAKAEDPKELRARIATLERELRTRPAEKEVVEKIVERIVHVDRPVVTPVDRKFLQDAVSEMQRVAETVLRGANAIADVAHQREMPAEPAEVVQFRPSREAPNGDTPHDEPPLVRRDNEVDLGGGLLYELSKAERAFLGILMQFPQGRSKSQLATLAGYSPKSGAVDQALANLRKIRAIDGKASLVTITDEGRNVIGDDYERLPTGKELQRYWIEKMPRAPSQFLEILIGAFPGSLTKTELAEAVGYSPKSGAVDQALADLRKRELITGTASELRASANLF